jgi:hypothetical protein
MFQAITSLLCDVHHTVKSCGPNTTSLLKPMDQDGITYIFSLLSIFENVKGILCDHFVACVSVSPPVPESHRDGSC